MTPWTAAPPATLCFSISQSCSNSCPLSQWCCLSTSSSAAPFSFCCQSFPASEFFQRVGSSHQVAKILELQLQHQSFQWIFMVDSIRTDWFVLLAAQGTLKSFLQPHNSKASILQHSALFMVQLSHHTSQMEKPQLWLYRPLSAKWCVCFLTCHLKLLGGTNV